MFCFGSKSLKFDYPLIEESKHEKLSFTLKKIFLAPGLNCHLIFRTIFEQNVFSKCRPKKKWSRNYRHAIFFSLDRVVYLCSHYKTQKIRAISHVVPFFLRNKKNREIFGCPGGKTIFQEQKITLGPRGFITRFLRNSICWMTGATLKARARTHYVVCQRRCHLQFGETKINFWVRSGSKREMARHHPNLITVN